MKMHHLRNVVPGILAATALALAVAVAAQTPPPAAASPGVQSPPAAKTMGHHRAGTSGSKHATDMKAECEAMMAKHQEMREKLQAMDTELDNLVAAMNAAKGSKEADAMEKPMAAVLNALVAQRKTFLSMMMEMQPAMMAHMTRHMQMHGTKGGMECPMMKTGHAPETKAEETKPKM